MQTILRRRGNQVKTRVTRLIQELVDLVPLEKIPSLEWGKNNEHNAAAAFMKLKGVKLSYPKVLPCALFIFKSHPYIRATPDHILLVNAVSAEYTSNINVPIQFGNLMYRSRGIKPIFSRKLVMLFS